MADLTQRNNAARHREHDRKHRLLNEQYELVTGQVTDLQGRITRLEQAGASDETLAGMRQELERLLGIQTSFGNQVTEFSNQLASVDGRVSSLERWKPHVNERLEAVEVSSNAHATAIARLSDANGWVPIAAAAVAGLITYVVIEVFHDTATHIQWAWVLVMAAVAGIVASFLAGSATSRASASSQASATVGTAPAPADQAPAEPPTATVPVADAQPPAPPMPAPVPSRRNVSASAAAQVNG